jgi:hypothetical protein
MILFPIYLETIARMKSEPAPVETLILESSSRLASSRNATHIRSLVNIRLACRKLVQRDQRKYDCHRDQFQRRALKKGGFALLFGRLPELSALGDWLCLLHGSTDVLYCASSQPLTFRVLVGKPVLLLGQPLSAASSAAYTMVDTGKVRPIFC